MNFILYFLILSHFYYAVFGGGEESYEERRKKQMNLLTHSEFVFNFSSVVIEAFTMAEKFITEQTKATEKMLNRRELLGLLADKYLDILDSLKDKGVAVSGAREKLQGYQQGQINEDIWMEKYKKDLAKIIQLQQESTKALENVWNNWEKMNDPSAGNSIFTACTITKEAKKEQIDESELLKRGPKLIKISEQLLVNMKEMNATIQKLEELGYYQIWDSYSEIEQKLNKGQGISIDDELIALLGEKKVEEDLAVRYNKIVGPNCLFTFGMRAQHLLNTVKMHHIQKLQEKISQHHKSLEPLDLGLTHISTSADDYKMPWLGKEEL